MGLAVALAIACAVAIRLGAVPIPAGSLLDLITGRSADSSAATVLAQVRLPRVVLAVLCGAALAGSGSAWQGLLRNPLADPYLIGVASGGALGAGSAIALGFAGAWVPPAALLGALGAAALVVALGRAAGGREGGQFDAQARLLLAGVAVSALGSALLALLIVLRQQGLETLYFWMLGGFSGRGWAEVGAVAPYVVAGLAVLAWQLPALNLLQLGDGPANALGVPVVASRRWISLAATVLAAAVVAEVGSIGFVGLVVPHLARLAVGADLRKSAPVAVLLGALLMVVADAVARTAWAPAEVPVGVLTALLGAPFFLYLLVRDRRMS